MKEDYRVRDVKHLQATKSSLDASFGGLMEKNGNRTTPRKGEHGADLASRTFFGSLA